MTDHGYVEVATYNHYPDYEHYTGDHIFVLKADEARIGGRSSARMGEAADG